MAVLQQKVSADYLQRCLRWLCLFGLLHLVFIWPGDILLSYALSGGFLLYRGYLKLGQQGPLEALWCELSQRPVNNSAAELKQP